MRRTFHRTEWAGALAFAIVLAAAGCGDDEGAIGPGERREFEADLEVQNEVPPVAVVTNASGTAEFEAQGGTVDYRIEVDDITGVIAAHIHVGAAGVAGPIVVPLFAQPLPGTGPLEDAVLVDSSFTQAQIIGVMGAAPISLDSLLVLMGNGNAYVNVHTAANPGGEIRGQLEEE